MFARDTDSIHRLDVYESFPRRTPILNNIGQDSSYRPEAIYCMFHDCFIMIKNVSEQSNSIKPLGSKPGSY